MDVLEAIRMKRAVRRFADRPLPGTAVEAILRAGRRAQSAKNTQPWQFIAITDRSTLASLAELGTYAGHLAGAALGGGFSLADEDDRLLGTVVLGAFEEISGDPALATLRLVDQQHRMADRKQGPGGKFDGLGLGSPEDDRTGRAGLPGPEIGRASCRERV